jgi:putative MATE family efflux protein
MKSSINLTGGSILRALISLSIPLILTNILQSAYNLTDTFWVGRLGSEAVSAVSLSFPIIFIMISLGMGLAIAGSILVAKAKGAQNNEELAHIATQTVFSVVSFSVLLSIIGYFLTPKIVGIMKVEPAVYNDAVSYLKISFLGMTPMFIFIVFQSLMKSIGEVKLPLYIVLSTVLLNLILDPFFIFGWHSFAGNGVKGAAIATVFTQLLAAVISIYYLLKGHKGVRINLRDYTPDKVVIKTLIKLGFPVSVEQISRSVGIFVMLFLVTGFGTMALASYGIGSRILSFIIIPVFGLGMATSTLVGQNLGAQKPDRVKKTIKLSLYIAFGIMSIFGLLTFLFASSVAHFFIPNEPETIKQSAVFIRYIAVSFGFMGILIVLIGAFRGAGKTKLSMSLTIFSVWIVRFPLAYMLSEFTEMKEIGIWISYPTTNIVTALVGLALLFKYHWLQNETQSTIKKSF